MLSMLREHPAKPLSGNPHVTRIEVERDSRGWELFIYVDEWTLDITRPIAEQVGRAYDALAVEAPDALMDNHIWQWSEQPVLRNPDARLHTLHSR